MSEQTDFTEGEVWLAWQRDRGLVVLVRTALLREKQTRLIEALSWHARRGRRLIQEWRVLRGVVAPAPEAAPSPRRRRRPRPWVRLVRG